MFADEGVRSDITKRRTGVIQQSGWPDLLFVVGSGPSGDIPKI